jgi:quercetin dioxygenase-like cupin family protein
MKIMHARVQPDMAPFPNFTGNIKTELIVFNEPSSSLQALKVYFAPGSRTDWHMHPKGQVLYIFEGNGLVQERGEPPHAVKAGDTIITEPGVWHWHGATPDSKMAHYAIYEKSEVEHGDLVGEEAYRTL